MSRRPQRDGQRFAATTLLLALGLLSGPMRDGLAAEGPVLGRCSKAQEARLGPAHCYFTDVALRDQSGRQQRLYSDLLKGKVVVITSFFTACVNSCPIVNATLSDLQSQLGDRLGSEVRFLSITSDPVLDTPEVLADYARRFAAQEGWLFLTGDESNVDLANYKLGFLVDEPSQHLNVIIVGNEATGLWKKLPVATSLSSLGQVIDDVVNDRAESR